MLDINGQIHPRIQESLNHRLRIAILPPPAIPTRYLPRRNQLHPFGNTPSYFSAIQRHLLLIFPSIHFLSVTIIQNSV
jgi:hypothetical protein